MDGKIKSPRCKACKTQGVRRTYKVRRNEKSEPQSRSERERRTFYEAIKLDQVTLREAETVIL